MEPSRLPESNKPSLARDLIRIHMIISRGMGVVIEHGQGFLKDGFPNEPIRKGYCDYLGCLVSVVDAHHLAENELAFPQFGVRIPAAPYKLLESDHKKMVKILAEIQKAAEGLWLANGAQALAAVIDALKRLRNMWFPHINIEETHFSEAKLAEVLKPEEQAELSGQLGRYSQQHTSPDYLIIPFLLYNLPPDERKRFSQALPAVVTQQLVPHDWKEQWQPMEPFLLA